MKQTRRSFLQAASLLAAALPLSSVKLSAGEKTAARPRLPRADGRGLLFDPEDVPRLRAVSRRPEFARSTFMQAIAHADFADDTKFLRDELRLNDHANDLLRAREILERTAFAHVLKPDPRQLALARLALSRIFEYKRWDYFLEGGTQTIGIQRGSATTMATAFAYDWLYDELTPAERAEILHQIGEKGAPACYLTLYGMMYPDRVQGWTMDSEDDYPYHFSLARWPLILNSTNLKTVPIAGLAVAACLLHGRHPLANEWLDMARRSARAFSVMFGTDGSYDEGASYWCYTTENLALYTTVLERTLGIDDRALFTWPGIVRYELGLAMPTLGHDDDCVNFGDAVNIYDNAASAWTARHCGDGVAQYFVENMGDQRNEYGLIFFDPAQTAVAPGPDLHDRRFDNDIVTLRTGWAADDSVVGLRSGGPSNHEHADRNSVIFKAYGERLFHDPFHAAYSPTLPLWLLRQTEAHTAVLIDGKGHQYHHGEEGTNASHAWAHVVDYRPEPGRVVVTSDATPAYALVNPDIALVRRTLVFLKPDVLILFDRIRKKTRPSTAQLRFQVFNEDQQGAAAATAGGFAITRPHASLQATAHAAPAPAVRSGRLPLAEKLGVYPFAEIAAEAALDHAILTVCTAQAAGKPHGQLAVTREGDRWRIRGAHNGLVVDVTLDATGDLPAVTLG